MFKSIFATLMMFALLLMISIMPAFAEPVDLMDSSSIMAGGIGIMPVLEISGAPPGKSSPDGVENLLTFIAHKVDKILAISAGAENTLRERFYDINAARVLQAKASDMKYTTVTGHLRDGPQRSFPLLC